MPFIRRSIRASRAGWPLRRSAGFALLVTITLLALVVLLLVGLATYTRVETAISGNTQKQAQARQNALLALDVALGQLQKHAGPDQRVTATAESFGGAGSSAHYTGVWDSTTPGLPARTWLVSGNETNPLAVTPATPVTGGAELVGRQSTGSANAVAAPLVPITTVGLPGQTGPSTIGRYAWWVGDQGVKASVGLPDASATTPTVYDYAPYTSAELRRRVRQQISIGAGAATAAGAMVFEPRDTTGAPINATLAANVVAPSQLAFLRASAGGTVGQANLQTNYFTWTNNNANVLASTHPLAPGLRRDLSLRPDLLGQAFAAWANYSPSRGGYMEDPAAPLEPAPLQPYQTDPVRRRYSMTARTVDNGIEHRIAPVLSFFGLSISVRNDTENNSPTRLEVSARCVVGLWNPYNAALVPEDLELVITGGLPTVEISATFGAGSRSVFLPSVLADSQNEMKFALPFTSDATNPDRSSWLPGRVYNWSAVENLAGPGSSGYFMRFYERNALSTTNGIVRDAGVPLGPNTVAGVQNYRSVAVGESQKLRFELRRAGTGEVLERFESPRFEAFPSGGVQRTVGAKSGDFAYVFRLPDRSEIPANETQAWLEAAGRDPREFQFSVSGREGYVVPGGQDLNPVLLINSGAASFDSSYSQLLLDRYTNTAGRNYNEDAPVFELPRSPLLSLGSLQHLLLPGERPFAVGNSWGGARNGWFDRFFFSGLTPETEWSNPARPLPNPLLQVTRRKVDGTATTAADLNGADRRIDGYSAKHLLQNGSFNLNSVSVPAWAATLRGVRFATAATNFVFANVSTGTGTTAVGSGDATTSLVEPMLTNSRVAGFPRFAQSAQETFEADDAYLQSDPSSSVNSANTPLFRRGIRFLTAAQVGALADKIVTRLRERHAAAGPFLTLEEFLSPSPLFVDAAGNQISLLERAIADAELNTDAALGLTTTTMEFSSQFLTQADIMTALAPVLFPRSDTFVIRTYGEAVNPATGAAEGRAWCEATVQRVPDYVDPADDATVPPALLTSPLNQNHGRRFKVVSFRWLTRSDI
jgi:Tfp pilus assembly protein PilX